MAKKEIIIKVTHRGLWYEDGVLRRVLDAGRYEIPEERRDLFGRRKGPRVEVVLVDVRQRDLTLKGQEILTRDKVALRVSIIVQFRVIDPRAALHEVENYEDRLYTDVQLAARRSLASQTLEDLLTNRTRLSDDISAEVKEAAALYGVAILRADVKDLVFPGNLQEVMNRVLSAERNAQAQLVEARTKAEVQRIDALAKAEQKRLENEAALAAQRAQADADADVQRVRAEAEARAAEARQAMAGALESHPALLRLAELEALAALAKSPAARIYVDFDPVASRARARSAEPDAQ